MFGSCYLRIMVYTAQANTQNPLNVIQCCLAAAEQHGEAPTFRALPVTHWKLKGQGSDFLSQASNKQAGGSGSHTSSGIH